ncbi:MAG TPA: hypothetical protein VFI09_04140 [Solirubrobacterales bacterium]|nr:hypothetical protein [Solirubrobacterales bacterium]
MRKAAKSTISALLAASALALSCLAPASALAFEETETHIFDPVLSLTGNCATNTLDPIPDPGCPEGEHPPRRFKVPRNAATDEYGDIYVANKPIIGEDTAAVIDVFSPQGYFLTEIPDHRGVERVAVDSEGNVYAHREFYDGTTTPQESESAIVLYKPKVYKPQTGEIEYEATPTYVAGTPPFFAGDETEIVAGSAKAKGLDFAIHLSVNDGIALDRSDGHLFVRNGAKVLEFGSAAEGNPLLDAHLGGTIQESYREQVLHYDSEGNLESEEKRSGGVDTGPVKARPPIEYVRNGEGKVVEEIIVGEEGPVVREGAVEIGRSVTVDSSNHDVYVDSSPTGAEYPRVVVLDGSDPEHPKVRTIDGSCLSGGHFNSDTTVSLSIAIDESNGHVFVDDRGSSDFSKPFVYEFTEAGACVSTIQHSFEDAFTSEIAIDNGAQSPNGALNPDGRYLFVPSGELGNRSHLYAFAPVASVSEAPEVESTSFGDVGETEATLRARVNPKGTATHYAFQYTTQASYEAEGFASALTAGEGDLPAGTTALAVSASLTGLSPGTTYRFRVVAESPCKPEGCRGEAESSFATFAPVRQSGSCPNAALRTGLSAALPDCRAYELVTPENTNGHAPTAPNIDPGPNFGTPPASPDGGNVAFLVAGGPLTGYAGAGSAAGDIYAAARTASGWQTESLGPDGTQASYPSPGGLSPDHSYATGWTGFGGNGFDGSLAVAPFTNYVRLPSGAIALIGEGSLATDPDVSPRAIAAGDAHLIFSADTVGHIPLQLEPDAPPTGTSAIYDRTPDGKLHVLSLLPGDVTPAAGEDAAYQGASADGSAVAFKLGATTDAQAKAPLYVRVDDAETLEAAPAGGEPTLAGISAAGRYVFYLNGGDLYRFDTETEARARITESGDATVVDVPAGGTSVYFVSPSVLTDEPNPLNQEAQTGQDNLYRWNGGAVQFVATVTEGDMGSGLGLWIQGLATGATALSPARSTPDGSALLFASEADLTSYESEGSAEIYRYDAAQGSLDCLSCDPTKGPPTGSAHLQTLAQTGDPGPVNEFAQIPNLSPDGHRAFFESPDALVPADTDERQDVYEWEANGAGSCATPGGCLFLISSGKSARDNYLFGVSESGNDAFVYSSDLLTAEDGDETPSVYDARVNGGFASGSSHSECQGEACQPAAEAPQGQTPASATFHGAGNVAQKAHQRRCGRGKRKLSRRGKVRCVPKHRRHHHRKHGHHKRKAHARAHANRRTAR